MRSTRPNRTRREYMTAEEVAAYFGIHPVTVRRLARSGDLPGYRIGKLWRFDPQVIKERKGA